MSVSLRVLASQNGVAKCEQGEMWHFLDKVHHKIIIHITSVYIHQASLGAGAEVGDGDGLSV